MQWMNDRTFTATVPFSKQGRPPQSSGILTLGLAKICFAAGWESLCLVWHHCSRNWDGGTYTTYKLHGFIVCRALLLAQMWPVWKHPVVWWAPVSAPTICREWTLLLWKLFTAKETVIFILVQSCPKWLGSLQETSHWSIQQGLLGSAWCCLNTASGEHTMGREAAQSAELAEHRVSRPAFLFQLYTEICTLQIFHIFLFPSEGEKLIKPIQQDKINDWKQHYQAFVML